VAFQIEAEPALLFFVAMTFGAVFGKKRPDFGFGMGWVSGCDSAA